MSAPRPVLLVKSGGAEAVPEWRAGFAAAGSTLDVRWFDDPAVDPAAVHYVLVWEPPPGRLAALPNLRLICSSGAGVDHILADPALPRHLPILRMGGDEARQRMGEYVALACLSLLRDMKRIVTAQAARRWDNFDPDRTAEETRVGIMGLGAMGTRAAAMLRGLGFAVSGWTRTPREVPGVVCHAGPEGLDRFLRGADILVNLLPDTPATRGIIDADLLARLPRGAGLVNAGRGPQLVVADLLAALDRGHLCGAILDVFAEEPLPAASPLWDHPKVIVSAHVASNASRRSRARYVAEAIATFERGEAVPNLYDPARGY